MIDNEHVPVGTVGWMIRVTSPPSMQEFFLVAIPNEAAAVEAVRARFGILADQTIEGVATLSELELAEHDLRSGQIKHA